MDSDHRNAGVKVLCLTAWLCSKYAQISGLSSLICGIKLMAVSVGFEPTVPFSTTVFKTVAINQTRPTYQCGGAYGTRTRDLLRDREAR